MIAPTNFLTTNTISGVRQSEENNIDHCYCCDAVLVSMGSFAGHTNSGPIRRISSVKDAYLGKEEGWLTTHSHLHALTFGSCPQPQACNYASLA